jgi:hypothetical protein
MAVAYPNTNRKEQHMGVLTSVFILAAVIGLIVYAIARNRAGRYQQAALVAEVRVDQELWNDVWGAWNRLSYGLRAVGDEPRAIRRVDIYDWEYEGDFEPPEVVA